MTKYALYPGHIHSMHDNDVHFIDAIMLARLYQVCMEECVVNPSEDTRQSLGLIALYPRYKGDYAIPNNEKSPN